MKLEEIRERLASGKAIGEVPPRPRRKPSPDPVIKPTTGDCHYCHERYSPKRKLTGDPMTSIPEFQFICDHCAENCVPINIFVEVAEA